MQSELFDDGGYHRKMTAILRACSEVADGMAYLHARGVVHGDLTGSNVLLQSNEVRCCLAAFMICHACGRCCTCYSLWKTVPTRVASMLAFVPVACIPYAP